MKVTVRQFIEAAIRFVKPRCEDCDMELEQVWIGSEEEPDLHYIHCPNPKCEAEYIIIVAFRKDTDIPDLSDDP